MRSNGKPPRDHRLVLGPMDADPPPGPGPDPLDPHPFLAHANEARHKMCVRCERDKTHPVHDAEPVKDPLGGLFPSKSWSIYGEQ